MPPEPSVTSASEGPRWCTLRYSSALLPKSFERPDPKSVSPTINCSGVEVVVWWRWIVDMHAPCSSSFNASVPRSHDVRTTSARHTAPERRFLSTSLAYLLQPKRGVECLEQGRLAERLEQ